MKKIVLVMLLTMMTSLSAAGFDVMLGAHIGGASSEAADGSSGDFESNFGLKLGFVEENSRFYVSYDNIDGDGHAALLNVEGKSSQYYGFIRGMIGAHAGALITDVVDTETNLMYGAQVGAIFDLFDSLSLDIVYRYSVTDSDGSLTDGPDNLQTVYGGLNLKF